MYNGTKVNLSGDDLLWLFNNTTEAFLNIKDIRSKTDLWIDGEVFTFLRRRSNEGGASDAIISLFNGKMKNFANRVYERTSKKDQGVLIAMYDGIRRRMVSSEPDPLTELNQALLAMQASARKAEEVANSSAKLREGLEGIRVLLEDKEPLVKEENENG